MTGNAARGFARERSFSLMVAVVLGVLGVWSAARGRPVVGVGAALLGVAAGIAGLARPGVLRAPARVWFALSARLGAINARVLLTVMFFLVLTPVGFVRRRRTDVLGMRRRTGWLVPPPRHRDPRHFERLH